MALTNPDDPVNTSNLDNLSIPDQPTDNPDDLLHLVNPSRSVTPRPLS